MDSSYEPLRKALLRLGPDYEREDWETQMKVPEVAAATDRAVLGLVKPYAEAEVDLDDPANWLPVRAWRIAALRRLPRLLEPMLAVADHDDDHLAFSEFPRVGALIGAGWIAPLSTILGERRRSDAQRMLAARGLGSIAKEAQPADRRRAVAALERQIAIGPAEEGEINAVAAEALIELEATEAKDTLFDAYLAGRVALGVVGIEAMERVFGKPGQ